MTEDDVKYDNTDKKEGPRPVSVYLRPVTEKEVSRRGDNRSQIIARDLDRLYSLYRRALIDVEFTEAEACLIVDTSNGALMDADTARLLWAHVDDAIKTYGLGKKWGVDGQALVEKLRGLNELQSLALVDAAERFWEGSAAGNMRTGVRMFFNITD